LIGSGCSLILVDHAVEDPSSPYQRVDRDDHGRIMVRWMLGRTLMWTTSVEMGGVFVEHPAGVPLLIDQDPAGALFADAADEPFGVTARSTSPWRGLDHVDAVGSEYRLGGRANLVSRSRTRNRNDAARSMHGRRSLTRAERAGKGSPTKTSTFSSARCRSGGGAFV
jgi:hypothetical protein